MCANFVSNFTIAIYLKTFNIFSILKDYFWFLSVIQYLNGYQNQLPIRHGLGAAMAGGGDGGGGGS